MSVRLQLRTLIFTLLLATCLLFLVASTVSFYQTVASQQQQYQARLVSQLETQLNQQLRLQHYSQIPDLLQSSLAAELPVEVRYVDPVSSSTFRNTATRPDVPLWFQSFIPGTSAVELALNTAADWPISVRVRLDDSFLLESVWSHVQQLSMVTCLCLLLTWLIAQQRIKRWLSPLQSIQHQAKLLTEKRYQILDPRPMTDEFHAVVSAMNELVHNIQAHFLELTERIEQLNSLLFLDPLTGLPNRKALITQFDSYIDLNQQQGNTSALILIELSALSAINEQQGYGAGDTYVQRAADLLNNHIQLRDDCQLYRISGSEFVLLTSASGLEAQHILDSLQLCFQVAQTDTFPESFARAVAVPIRSNGTFEETIRAADEKRILAQSSAKLTLGFLEDQAHWTRVLQEFTRILVKTSDLSFRDYQLHSTNDIDQYLQLHQQPVCHGQDCLYHELLVRFQFEGSPIPPSDVFHTADRLGVLALLEKVVIGFILRRLQGRTGVYAINLSRSAIYDQRLSLWLKTMLSKYQASLPQLLFEISEQSIIGAKSNANALFSSLKAANASIIIERFGASYGSLTYLQDLNIDGIKLDGSFTRAADLEETRFFLHSVRQLGRSLGLKVIASQVETTFIQQHCEEIGFDGLQGMAVAPPEPYPF